MTGYLSRTLPLLAAALLVAHAPARGEQAAYVAPIGPILSATGVVLDLESP